MSGILQDNYWFSEGAGGQLARRALRFVGLGGYTTTAYLQKTWAANPSVTTVSSLSVWVKLGVIPNTYQYIASGGPNTSNLTDCVNWTDASFRMYGSASTVFLTTPGVYRDPNAWYHLLFNCDSNTTTGVATRTIFINGQQVATDTNTVTAGTDPGFHPNWLANPGAVSYTRIGEYWNGGYPYFGCMYEMHVSDGTIYQPSTFGQYNAQGVWVPKVVSGVNYGTSGWYFKFADPDNIGEDSSGNNNDFTAVGDFSFDDSDGGGYFAGSDQTNDSPINNYFQFNPLNNNIPLMQSKANNAAYSYYAGDYYTFPQKLGPSTNGKYVLIAFGIGGETNIRIAAHQFYESLPTTPGVSSALFQVGWTEYDASNYYTQTIGGGVQQFSGVLSSGNSPANGWFVVVDEPAGKYWLGYMLANDPSTQYFVDASLNANPTANPDAGTSPTGTFTPGTGLYYLDTYYTNNTSSPPMNSPFRAWEDFVPQIPNISTFSYVNNSKRLQAAPIPDPSDHFDVITDTGANILTAAQSKFSTGLWWIKDRANANQHQIGSSATNGVTGAGDNFIDCPGTVNDSDCIGYTAPSGNSIAWNWKGTSVTGTDLSTISSSGQLALNTLVRNTTTGFSSGTYNGSALGSAAGTQGDFAHGLTAAPDLVFVTCMDGVNGNSTNTWQAYHSAIPGSAGQLKTTNAFSTSNKTNFWAEATQPVVTTNTLIRVRVAPASGITDPVNRPRTMGLTGPYFFAAWHAVAGYSSFGTFDGNSSTDGSFIYTGFSPAFIMIKCTTNATNWIVEDNVRSPYNPATNVLSPNLTSAEVANSASQIDFLSNGFKLRANDGPTNTSGRSYVYAAFAKHPFGGSNVSPATAR